MFRVTLSAEDKLALLTGIGVNDVQIPRAELTRAMFAELPTALVGSPLPYVLGDFSSVASATAPPAWATNTTRNMVYDGSGWIAGYGDAVSDAAPPLSLTLTEAAGGSMNLGDVPSNTYYVAVVALDAQDDAATPFPLLPTGESVTITGNSKKIQVSWTEGSPVGTTYRAYLGQFYYGVRYHQYIETASTSCEFDAEPPFGVTPTPDNISTGASLATGGWIWYYALSAIMGDGETTVGLPAQWVSYGIDRPAYLEWTAVAGATGYRLYKRSTVGWVQRFDLSTVTNFTDDHTGALAVDIDALPVLAGAVPLTYVGRRADLNGVMYHAFLVSAGAVKSVLALYRDGVQMDAGHYGVDWFLPGGTGFAVRFGNNAIDLAGQTMTLVYGIGPTADSFAAGENVLTCTMTGLETVGDSSGTVITDLSDQYEWLLRNLLLRDVRSGNWEVAGPMWGDTPIDVDQVDATSFATVQGIWDNRISGGCPGAWILGRGENGELQRETVRTWLARLNQSLDVYAGFSRKSQYVVKTIDETADLSTAPQYTPTGGINEGTFAIEDKPEQIENRVVIRYALDFRTGTWSETTVEDIDAQVAIGEVKTYTLSLWAIRQPDVAYEIGLRRLARRKYPYRLVRWESDMGALTVDLGDTVLVTHPDGAGASGWTDRAVFILKHEFDPQRFVITLEGLDLDALITSLESPGDSPTAT